MPEASHPTHLDPSELGTKEYWDEYYERDLNGGDEADEDDSGEEPPDPSELDSWFDDVDAPAKTLAFLTSTTFPLSPNYSGRENDELDRLDNASPAVLDLGTGNGSALFSLHLHGGYTAARVVGVDYSRRSIELAEKLRLQYSAHWASSPTHENETASATAAAPLHNISFYTFDVINEDPKVQEWWPRGDSDCDPDSTTDPIPKGAGFDLVLDKGTFDAISLSSDRAVDPTKGLERRICELYPTKVLAMTRLGGFLLVTSCNWTESEVISWFTGGADGANIVAPQQEQREDSSPRFEVYDTLKYPVFEFGGQKGQGVATVCFKKVAGR
ncbi:hypothetical protein A1O7_03179 [Cladophialophora yegresii CBS 114405]|uniref:Protein-lysine N-methyltransferase EFM4 n=1 Tax=Cladophialophora yegresii CBS 114405 TaxID=1182544 RepID=W9WDV6_9EURO|nr:uncharacterized protein A1O7_03179 [Cladophialophora yegresii CBS 114405]EXJ62741.1 hypothetical protein A1O7_03179 [Cladophialophora yegresii CBS 114405]